MTTWTVVGGGDKGGILVRTGKDLKSEEAPTRLSTGSKVKALGIEGDRLNFEKLTGDGPETGWVSIKLKGAVLLTKDKAKKDNLGKWKVVFKPKIALRKEPSAEGPLAGALKTGEIIEALEASEDNNWIRFKYDSSNLAEAWAMIIHPEHGRLLAKAPVSLKKEYETEFIFKGCGANMRKLKEGSAGASRDQFLEYQIEQHLEPNVREEFLEKIPDMLCDTRCTDEDNVVVYFRTAGHISPDPETVKKNKPAPGGVHQYIEHLAGLRCIIVEAENVGKVSLVVVLAHGIDVKGFDLYGLADHASMPGVRFILPAAPHESDTWDPEGQEGKRPTLQWWPKKADRQKGSAEAGEKLLACAQEALAKAPGAKLVLGGFSQGAFVALQAAIQGRKVLRKPAVGLMLLCAPWADEGAGLPQDCLKDTDVLIASGDEDQVASPEGCELMFKKCQEAAGKLEPLVRFCGGHEVTEDVANMVAEFMEAHVHG